MYILKLLKEHILNVLETKSDQYVRWWMCLFAHSQCTKGTTLKPINIINKDIKFQKYKHVDFFLIYSLYTSKYQHPLSSHSLSTDPSPPFPPFLPFSEPPQSLTHQATRRFLKWRLTITLRRILVFVSLFGEGVEGFLGFVFMFCF